MPTDQEPEVLSAEELEILRRNKNAWPGLEHPVPRFLATLAAKDKQIEALERAMRDVRPHVGCIDYEEQVNAWSLFENRCRDLLGREALATGQEGDEARDKHSDTLGKLNQRTAEVERLRKSDKRLESAVGILMKIQSVVDAQAEDEALWAPPVTAPEAYQQQELRKLHAVIEGPKPESLLERVEGCKDYFLNGPWERPTPENIERYYREKAEKAKTDETEKGG